MSKSDLKAAMESLQVKKPLRLPAQTPAFRAPPAPVSQSEKQSRDINISTDSSTSQDGKTPQDDQKNTNDSEPRVPTTLAPIKSQDTKSSVDAIASLDQNASEVPNTSPDAIESHMVPRTSQPRRATQQDRAVTEAASTKARLSTGYTRVPNSILMEMVSGDLSRNEMKILMLVARMTISFNRSLVPLSKGVIERMTGIQGRAVLDAIQSLEKSGLLRKVTGDHNAPNRLGLIYEPWGENKSEDEFSTKDQKPPQRQGAESPYKKDSFEKIDLRKKISLSKLSPFLREYFADIKPRRKRESEFQSFESLLSDFSEQQIELCLRFLQHSGTSCHSPMAYLAKAISQILPQAEAGAAKKQRVAEEQRAQAEASKRRAEEQEREEQESALRVQAFQKVFPSQEAQKKAIAQYSTPCPGLDPDSTIMRKLAISAWWSGLEEDQRALFRRA